MVLEVVIGCLEVVVDFIEYLEVDMVITGYLYVVRRCLEVVLGCIYVIIGCLDVVLEY